jgi:hypothetical protein
VPNHCNNHITLRFNSGNELQDFVNHYLQHYDGAWDKKIVSQGTRGIVISHTTRWQPDFDWLKETLERHRDCWIKDEWIEESGIAGVWVGQYSVTGVTVVEEMKWNDLSIEERHLFF